MGNTELVHFLNWSKDHVGLRGQNAGWDQQHRALILVPGRFHLLLRMGPASAQPLNLKPFGTLLGMGEGSPSKKSEAFFLQLLRVSLLWEQS